MNEHLNDSIRIVAADSIRDSIRTKISDSQVPTRDILEIMLQWFWGIQSTRTQYQLVPV